MPTFRPTYIETYKKGLLASKIETAYEILKSCTLCPRKCKVDRSTGETGVCKTGEKAVVSSFNAHFGEEDPLVGTHGSGTIFFTHCNLLCIFCQNYDISHLEHGEEITNEHLAGIMIHLQNKGCHNINFVTPSHVVPQILSALEIAIPEGLSVPLVYNTGGYDSVKTLKLLEGVFDIYMPDFKFWDSEIAKKTCNAKDYPEIAQKALIEMHRQVGDLVTDDRGIAQSGILLRHLVLPSGFAGTREIMRFIARKISLNTYVNIMPQYRPCGRADEVKELSVYLSQKDYETAIQVAKDEGIERLDSRRRRFMIF
jgi:putative pyruvate formate lyase activating enzyme